MKEIRMDWETYQREMEEAKKEANETGSFCVSYNIANCLEEGQPIEECLCYDSSTNKQINRIASFLKKKHELKNNESKLVTEEEEEDVSTITKYA